MIEWVLYDNVHLSPLLAPSLEPSHLLSLARSVAVEVMECLLRPYEVRNTAMVTPNLGPACDAGAMETQTHSNQSTSQDVSSSKSTSVAGRMEVVTGQPLKIIAGHTGYLVFATLNPKLT